MAFEINVKGQLLEIKFNYRTMYKANRELGSIDENGNKQEDGASNLFLRVLQQDDSAIFDLIKLTYKGKGLKEDDIFDALEERFEGAEDEAKAYDELFDDMKDEMLRSGFFTRKLEAQIENLEKGITILEAREDKDSQTQATMLRDVVGTAKKEISSAGAQD